jgi:hypothetical protein
VQTVVARFNHLNRNLTEVEADLIAHGAADAAITGYIVAMTFDTESHKDATKAAKRALDNVGATRIKVTKHGPEVAAPPANQA